MRSLAGTIGTSYPAVAQHEAQGAVIAIDGLNALRGAATGTQIPAVVVIQEYASTIDQLLALEDEIATGSNDAALVDTVRVVGLISAAKEEISQEQAILTSALTTDLVGATQFQPGQLSAINAAQAQQQADLAQFSLTATGSQRQLYENALSSGPADHAQAQVQQAIAQALGGGSSAENPAFTNAASGSAYLVASLHTVEQGFMSSILGQSGSLRDRAITSALAEGVGVMLVLALALLFTDGRGPLDDHAAAPVAGGRAGGGRGAAAGHVRLESGPTARAHSSRSSPSTSTPPTRSARSPGRSTRSTAKPPGSRATRRCCGPTSTPCLSTSPAAASRSSNASSPHRRP